MRRLDGTSGFRSSASAALLHFAKLARDLEERPAAISRALSSWPVWRYRSAKSTRKANKLARLSVFLGTTLDPADRLRRAAHVSSPTLPSSGSYAPPSEAYEPLLTSILSVGYVAVAGGKKSPEIV